MGSSGGNSSGKGSTLISAVANPVQGLRLFGNDSVNKFVDYADPIGNAATQANENTFKWLNGEEEFGAHSNWFGNGPAGDFSNQMMGGTTEAGREQEAENIKAWDTWSAQNGTNNPYRYKKRNKTASFLISDEEGVENTDSSSLLFGK